MLPEINADYLQPQGKWIVFEAVEMAQSSIITLPDAAGEDCGVVLARDNATEDEKLKKINVGDLIFVRRAAYEPMPAFKRSYKPRKIFYVHIDNVVAVQGSKCNAYGGTDFSAPSI